MLDNLKKITDRLKIRDQKMPVLFIGHGSPMNGIEDNAFSNNWKLVGKEVDKPSAVLVISAHWLSRGTYVTAMPHPQTIHDFGGFPQALFDVQYPAPCNPELAADIKNIVQYTNVGLAHDWGLDHGAWTVVRHMFPDADIPVLQLSIDYYKPAEYHYALAKELKVLRNKGVLIIGSGNIVHNLRMVAWDKVEDNYGFDWAKEAHDIFNKHILLKNHEALFDLDKMGSAVKLAVPTPDHYYPLIYTVGMQGDKEEVTLFNDELVGGSLSMTSLVVNSL